jgi:hypothetical protein
MGVYAGKTMIVADLEPLCAEAARQRMADGGRNKGVADLPHPSQ